MLSILKSFYCSAPKICIYYQIPTSEFVLLRFLTFREFSRNSFQNVLVFTLPTYKAHSVMHWYKTIYSIISMDIILIIIRQ